MRYFDLRGLLPHPDQPSTEAFPLFDRIPPAPALPPFPLATGNWQLATHSRHTSPDLAAQLDAAAKSPPDTLLLNLLDGDATLRLNAALAARYPDELLAALDHLEKRLSPKRTWILLDATAPSNWLAPIRAAARLARRRVIPLRNDYPESDPSLLLYTLLKRKLKPGRLPTDVRALLVDAPAALALSRHSRPPLPSTPPTPPAVSIAVHHPDWPATRYADVDPGTPLGHALAHLGLRAEDYTLRAGGLLRDQRVTPDYPLGPGELTFHATHPERPANPDPCVRCGWCYEGCPTRVHPAGLLEAAQRRSLPLARHYGLDACIECGICSYVCPSQLPILAGIRALRATKQGAE
jgi:electron transport complex protein RnfC